MPPAMGSAHFCPLSCQKFSVTLCGTLRRFTTVIVVFHSAPSAMWAIYPADDIGVVVGGVTGPAPIVILKVTVMVDPAAGPKGVCTVPIVCRSTFNGVLVDVGVA